MKEQKQLDLNQLFLSIQKPMISELNNNRGIITHPTAQGSNAELCWLQMFKKYLPHRYQAENGFVVDSKGRISDQIDIIVFDRQYSPFLLNNNGTIYVPAESVYCVYEVKPSLNKSTLEYSANKAKSVRRLYRTNATIYHVEGVVHQPKEPFEILAGLLALESDWKDYYSDKIKAITQNFSPLQKIDLICALKCGSFILDNNKKNTMKTCNSSKALIFFFLNFLSLLQKLGTVPAIDMEEYLKSLEGDIK